MRSRGCALQFFLTALFEAQCRTRPEHVVSPSTRPLKPLPQAAGQASWVDLVGASADPTRRISGGRSINNIERRARQIRQALLTLASDGGQLVEFADPSASRHYRSFYLMNEARRDIGSAVRYAVPGVMETNVFRLDTGLLTNGWVNILEDTELAFLFMVADLQARASDSDPVPVDGQTRVGYYCLGTDGYQSYHLLERVGLLRVARPAARRLNGTFRAATDNPDEIEGAPLKFSIDRNGFGQAALDAVMRALQGL